MKKIHLLFIIFSIFIFTFCNDDITTNPDDSFVTVTIGNQVWMRRNLDLDHYRNGDSIPQVKDSLVWASITTGAWCYNYNDPKNGKVYGKLYNWFAVNDPRGLAPAGWHIPSKAEWAILTDYLGGELVAGSKLKERGTFEGGDGLWHSPNTGATNENGFSALPGSFRYFYGLFYPFGENACWWASTEVDSLRAWLVFVDYYEIYMLNEFNYKTTGFSVRCVKD